MTPDESVKALLLLTWIGALGLLRWRQEQQRKAEAAIARGIVETRRHRLLDRTALVFAALAVGGVAFYVGRYGEGWIALVFGLVWLAFTVWGAVQRRRIDRTP